MKILVLLCIASGIAVADGAKTWERDTTAKQRDEAHKTFSAGNDAFFRRDYAKALDLYEQALARFAHPRIRLAAAEVVAKRDGFIPQSRSSTSR